MAERSGICPAFLEVAKAIAAASNLPAILQSIVEHTVNLTGAKASGISLLDASGHRLKLAAAFGLSDELIEKFNLDLKDDPIGQEVLRGATVTVPDIQTDTRIVFKAELTEQGIASFTTVELAAGERPLGHMTLYKTTTGLFSENDLEIFLTMANLASVGVETSRTYDRVYRRCADLAVLNQAAEDINVSLRTNEVIRAIVTEVPKVLNAKACSLRLYDPARRVLAPVAAHGLAGGLLEKEPISLEDSPIDDEALKGHVVAVNDISSESRWRHPERAAREGIHSAVISPMIIKGKPVGTIWIFDDKPREYAVEEKSLLMAIARHSAIAIENARLFEMSVKTHDQLVQDVWSGLPDVWGTITGGEERAA